MGCGYIIYTHMYQKQKALLEKINALSFGKSDSIELTENPKIGVPLLGQGH